MNPTDLIPWTLAVAGSIIVLALVAGIAIIVIRSALAAKLGPDGRDS